MILLHRAAAFARAADPLATVNGAVLCGDMNVPFGGDEYASIMAAMNYPPDVLDRGGELTKKGSATLTFPIARWVRRLVQHETSVCCRACSLRFPSRCASQ